MQASKGWYAPSHPKSNFCTIETGVYEQKIPYPARFAAGIQTHEQQPPPEPASLGPGVNVDLRRSTR